MSRAKHVRSFFAAAGALALAGPAAQAAIVLNLGDNISTFAAVPGVTEYSTLGAAVAGTGAQTVGDIPGMDAQVQTVTPSLLATALTGTTTIPPSTNFAFRHRTNEQQLQSRPTTTAVAYLLATLQNGTAETITGLDVKFDLSLPAVATTETVTEQLPGEFVYVSPTGATGSWARIGQASTAGPASFNASGLNIAPGATFYVLFADDNADSIASSVDQGYWIDNLNFVPTVPEPTGVALAGIASLGWLARRRRA